ncbi:tRNA (adenosine(37)-N6)-threonylcarbamoyltransferase complex ATPase subunit type 1 TsaE [Allobaculum stercoricanis]|uniref:tRNA (adenosine(37)-N6)-threonylcarbamoyltransferase complex ATPase subunit type 1 TsaE n=1 Tax=Allobaculum stercoricanis TaxID=174709 RepID=UPI000382D3D2|nr:tRNA (adenosine(37)-N6)-threonylcarbamoyltransferase complex ATPase subunit type 1 TsaE [Allobaculum stercoricanis]
MKLILNSLSDTEAFAQKMADRLKGKTMTITLDGDLGAGKTAWTRFFGKALGVKRTINSPTFTIMKSYRTQDGSMLYHMDAYRLEDGNQDLGFEECFEEGLCVVEWSNYIAQQIPADHIAISIRETGETSREVIMEATGKNAQAVLEGWE